MTMTIRKRLTALPQIGWFLGQQYVTRLVDRYVHRQSREEAVLAFVLAQATRGSPQSVLQAMDLFARRRRWLQNVGPRKGAILMQALRDAQARRVLEIGSYCGYSATLMGEYLAGCGGQLTAIELSRRNAAVATRIVEHAGLAAVVSFRRGTLESEIGALGAPFDAVFLDHWKDVYLPDLRRLEDAGLLRPGTVVVADNVGFFDVPDYLDHVRHSGRYRSRFERASVEYQDALEDGVEVSVFTG
ncbi:MAG: class I SAM-dependent methyltransferase [Gammaproteobacteria bacterium]|nr:class I SAM-dependent methyltransferase [Gammaproteobacteria bacterium]